MDASLLDTEWIWHPDWVDHGQKSAGGLVHFRKQLDLETVPLSPLKIQITADTKYKLYVNSNMVHAGPVKGDEHMWFYDEVDVQPFLKTGTNRIGVRVLRFYYATPYATSFPRLPIPGLFFRTPDSHLRETYGLQSDNTWDCALDAMTVLRIDQKEDDFLHIYEDVNATRESALAWVRAKLLQLPKSHGLAPPWILSPRLIPATKPSAKYFKAIHNIRSPLPRNDWEHLLLPSSDSVKSLRLPAGSSHHKLGYRDSVHPTKFNHLTNHRDFSPHYLFTMDPKEAAIQLAIQDYHAGVYTSERAAAKAYGVPRTTLRDRLNGATNSATSHQHQQRLSPEQEEFLVQ